MTNRRSTFKASVALICWGAIPLGAFAAVAGNVGLLAGAPVGLTSLLILVILVWRVSKRSSPFLFKRRNLRWRVDRLIEHSFLGAGSLKGWTVSNRNVTLADLRSAEAPVITPALPDQEMIRQRATTSNIHSPTRPPESLVAHASTVTADVAPSTGRPRWWSQPRMRRQSTWSSVVIRIGRWPNGFWVMVTVGALFRI